MPVDIADALRESMEERGFNQAELSAFVKVEPMYVSRWLRGTQPRFEEGLRILESLGWRLERLKGRAGLLSKKSKGVQSSKSKSADEALPELKTGSVSENGDIRFSLRKTQVDSHIWMMSRGLLVAGNEVVVLRNDSGALGPKYPRGIWIIAQAISSKKDLKPHVEYLLPDNPSGSILRLFRIVPVSKGSKSGKPLAIDVARSTSRAVPSEFGKAGAYRVVASASVS